MTSVQDTNASTSTSANPKGNTNAKNDYDVNIGSYIGSNTGNYTPSSNINGNNRSPQLTEARSFVNGLLSPFSPLLRQQQQQQQQQQQHEHEQQDLLEFVSLQPCRKVSVVVRVLPCAGHEDDRRCLFPNVNVNVNMNHSPNRDRPANANANAKIRDKETTRIPDQDDNFLRKPSKSALSPHDMVVVKPSAFGKVIPSQVTLETARLVAQVAHISSEDWARLYEFHHVMWPEPFLESATIDDSDSDTDSNGNGNGNGESDGHSDNSSNPTINNNYNTMDSLSRAVVQDALVERQSSLLISMGQASTCIQMHSDHHRQISSKHHDQALPQSQLDRIITQLQRLMDPKAIAKVTMVELKNNQTNGGESFRDLFFQSSQSSERRSTNNKSPQISIRHVDMKGAILEGLTQLSLDEVQQHRLFSQSKQGKNDRNKMSSSVSPSSTLIATIHMWDNAVAYEMNRPSNAQITCVELPRASSSSSGNKQGTTPSIFPSLSDLTPSKRKNYQNHSNKGSHESHTNIHTGNTVGLGLVIRQLLLHASSSVSTNAISYRESTITQVLQRSLESSKIVILASVSQLSKDYDTTLTTLNFLRSLLVKPGKTANSPFPKQQAHSQSLSPDDSMEMETRIAEQLQKYSTDEALLEQMLSDPRQRLAKILDPSPARKKVSRSDSSSLYNEDDDDDDDDDYQPVDYMKGILDLDNRMTIDDTVNPAMNEMVEKTKAPSSWQSPSLIPTNSLKATEEEQQQEAREPSTSIRKVAYAPSKISNPQRKDGWRMEETVDDKDGASEMMSNNELGHHPYISDHSREDADKPFQMDVERKLIFDENYYTDDNDDESLLLDDDEHDVNIEELALAKAPAHAEDSFTTENENFDQHHSDNNQNNHDESYAHYSFNESDESWESNPVPFQKIVQHDNKIYDDNKHAQNYKSLGAKSTLSENDDFFVTGEPGILLSDTNENMGINEQELENTIQNLSNANNNSSHEIIFTTMEKNTSEASMSYQEDPKMWSEITQGDQDMYSTHESLQEVQSISSEISHPGLAHDLSIAESLISHDNSKNLREPISKDEADAESLEDAEFSIISQGRDRLNDQPAIRASTKAPAIVSLVSKSVQTEADGRIQVLEGRLEQISDLQSGYWEASFEAVERLQDDLNSRKKEGIALREERALLVDTTERLQKELNMVLNESGSKTKQSQKIQKIQEQVEDLQLERNDLEATIKTLGATTTGLEKEISSREEELAKAIEEIKSERRSHQASIDTNSKLGKLVEDLKTENERILISEKNMEASLLALKNENTLLRQEATSRDSDVHDLMKKLQEREMEIEGYKSRSIHQSQEQQKVEQLETSYKTVELRLQDTEREKAFLERNRQKDKAKIENLESELQRQILLKDDLLIEKRSFSSELVEMKQRLSCSEDESKTRESVICRLKDRCHHLETKMTENGSDKSFWEEQTKQLNRNMEALEEEIRVLSREKHTSESKIQQLESRLDKESKVARAEGNRLRERFMQTEHEKQEIESTILRMKTEHYDAQQRQGRQVEMFKVKAEELESELDRLRQRENSFKDAKDAEIVTLRQQHNELLSQHDSVHAKSMMLELQLQTADERVADLKSQLESSRIEFTQIQNELRSTRERNEENMMLSDGLVQGLNRRIVSLEKDLMKAIQEGNHTSTILKEEASANETLASQMKQKEEELYTMKMKNDEYQKELVEIQNELKITHENSEDKTSHSIQTIQKLRSRIEDLEANLNTALQERNLSSNISYEEASTNRRLAMQLHEAEERLSNAQKDQAKYIEQLKDQEDERMEQNAKIARMGASLRRLESSARKNLGVLTAGHQDNNNELKNLRKNHQTILEKLRKVEKERNAFYCCLKTGRDRLSEAITKGRKGEALDFNFIENAEIPTLRESSKFETTTDLYLTSESIDQLTSVRREEIASCVAASARASIQGACDENSTLRSRVHSLDDDKHIEIAYLQNRIRHLENVLSNS